MSSTKEAQLSIKEALKTASATLQNPKEAAILLAHHLQRDRLYLITHDGEALEDSEGYFALVKRRQNHEPIEYITQSVSFYGEQFHINEGALIPRPETELLVDRAAALIKEHALTSVAEIGVGSGIVSIMLARKFPEIEIVATDINEKALEIARINTKRFSVEERITLVHTSCLDNINRHFDMIVSNPPYIQEGVALEAPLGYEPQNALFGGKAGDEILRCIVDLACDRGVRYLACEMGYDQRAPLAAYMQKKGLDAVTFYKDYSGFDRGFTATIKE